MPSTLDIRRRIRSVKNTAQITKAMQMVAASKMRKSQAAALAGKPYQDALNRVLGALRGKVDPQATTLLVDRPVHRELILVISTDKGLCGALNTNLFRELTAIDATEPSFSAVGRKAVQFLARTRRDLLADFQVSELPKTREVRPIANFCMERFLTGEFDRVRVVYSKFVNTLVQEATTVNLLPVSPVELLGEEKESKVSTGEFLFEPNEQGVLSGILPHYVSFQIFQMILDARASEHSARMVAMKNATDNAKQLVKDLTLHYNKVRQAGITTELLEIASAQLAVG
ncbi:MAG TPA: ATP synthase F1 subunit gamma [Chthoniobacterales bacterium]|nr:ATP synthase F1 subunit gamma [Chthoniobacterales bacterium]